MLKFKLPKLFAKKDQLTAPLSAANMSPEMVQLCYRINDVMGNNDIDIDGLMGGLYDININHSIKGGTFTSKSGMSYIFGATMFGVRKKASTWRVTTITEEECDVITSHVMQMIELRELLMEVAVQNKIAPSKDIQLFSISREHISVIVNGKMIVTKVQQHSETGDIETLAAAVLHYYNSYA